MSAAHRMVLDSVRTCLVWAAGLQFFNEDFSYLQLFGFLILISGTLVYNVIGPFRIPGLDYSEHDAPKRNNENSRDEIFQKLNTAIAHKNYREAATLQVKYPLPKTGHHLTSLIHR
eukprot:SAG31_NODE_274_length_18666_cov_72.753972_17_plen_116_part_00